MPQHHPQWSKSCLRHDKKTEEIINKAIAKIDTHGIAAATTYLIKNGVHRSVTRRIMLETNQRRDMKDCGSLIVTPPLEILRSQMIPESIERRTNQITAAIIDQALRIRMGSRDETSAAIYLMCNRIEFKTIVRVLMGTQHRHIPPQTEDKAVDNVQN